MPQKSKIKTTKKSRRIKRQRRIKKGKEAKKGQGSRRTFVVDRTAVPFLPKTCFLCFVALIQSKGRMKRSVKEKEANKCRARGRKRDKNKQGARAEKKGNLWAFRGCDYGLSREEGLRP